MGSCSETATVVGCAAARSKQCSKLQSATVGLIVNFSDILRLVPRLQQHRYRLHMMEGVIRMLTLLILCTNMLNSVVGLMVMDETSCHEIEEEECGLCHTVYMEECNMVMEMEMMPKKVSMCKNVTRFEDKCVMKMKHKMVEEKRPICNLEILNNTSTNYQKKQIMKCKLGMKKMKKYYPEKDCTKVAVGLDKKCFDMVKLQEEKHEVKKCSFHPKTVCRPSEEMKCKRVKKKMCNYIDSNKL